ncbi:MAG TPA: DinB family protein [Gemmatimonadales bacterium]|nr:DinB family protein [Gemmatimonadales bacterium]
MDLRELEAARDAFVASIEGLHEAQWRFRPSPEQWSIAEVAEHVALVSGAIGLMVRGPLLSAPADATHLPDEAKVRARLLGRTHKAKSPDRFLPRGTWSSPEEVRREFVVSREELLAWLRHTDAPLRSHAMPHPALGTLDGVEWLAFLAAHDLRHVAQIEDAKGAVGYPAG